MTISQALAIIALTFEQEGIKSLYIKLNADQTVIRVQTSDGSVYSKVAGQEWPYLTDDEKYKFQKI